MRQKSVLMRLQVTAAISPGSSGGPVVDSRGNVIGVAVATIRAGQNLNFAIPANYVKMLLSEPRKPIPLPEFRSTKQIKSLIADLGGPAVEGVVARDLVCTQRTDWRCWFSLANKLNSPVRNVRYLVILYSTKADHWIRKKALGVMSYGRDSPFERLRILVRSKTTSS